MEKIKAPNSSWIWLETLDILIPCSLNKLDILAVTRSRFESAPECEVSQHIYRLNSEWKLNKSPENSTVLSSDIKMITIVPISIYLVSHQTVCCVVRSSLSPNSLWTCDKWINDYGNDDDDDVGAFGLICFIRVTLLLRLESWNCDWDSIWMKFFEFISIWALNDHKVAKIFGKSYKIMYKFMIAPKVKWFYWTCDLWRFIVSRADFSLFFSGFGGSQHKTKRTTHSTSIICHLRVSSEPAKLSSSFTWWPQTIVTCDDSEQKRSKNYN